jgi:hypothetical protein
MRERTKRGARGARVRLGVAVVALALVGAPPAMAQEAPQESAQPTAQAAPGHGEDAPGRWRLTLTPYAWASGLGGELRPFAGAPTLRIEQGFSELARNVDAAGSMAFEAERGPWLLLADASFVDASREGRLPGGIPAEGATRQTTLMLAAGWRAFERDGLRVDTLAGARRLAFDADVQVLGGALSASPTRAQVNGVLGLSVRQGWGEDWTGTLRLEHGGLGDGHSHLAAGLLGRRLGQRATLQLGWRAMWLDHERGGTRVDVVLAGPLLGLDWRF